MYLIACGKSVDLPALQITSLRFGAVSKTQIAFGRYCAVAETNVLAIVSLLAPPMPKLIVRLSHASPNKVGHKSCSCRPMPAVWLSPKHQIALGKSRSIHVPR